MTCIGTNTAPAFPDLRGGLLMCRYCRSWVAPGAVTTIVPRHESPVTADDIQRAANVLHWEYRQARRNGTLHGDPYRWHVTALEMTRKDKHARQED